MDRPLIGISVDNLDNSAASGRYDSPIAYSRAVAQAGGLPLLLPHEPELAERYAELCAGLILTGGVDPKTEAFGEPTHPRARPLDTRRQEFELALIEALENRPAQPALGICLGMQLMSLFAGGKIHQYLPDVSPGAEVHQKCNRHVVRIEAGDSALVRGAGELDENSRTIVSSHQQAMARAGRLRVVARAEDGVIEAVDDPERVFYVGVQWHPERGDDGPLSLGLVRRFVQACRRPG